MLSIIKRLNIIEPRSFMIILSAQPKNGTVPADLGIRHAVFLRFFLHKKTRCQFLCQIYGYRMFAFSCLFPDFWQHPHTVHSCYTSMAETLSGTLVDSHLTWADSAVRQFYITWGLERCRDIPHITIIYHTYNPQMAIFIVEDDIFCAM